ncbi:MAG: hypothetical protein P4L50_21715 [Anaerolineaceae bacterium]|nr:hypothetical protein [Anaerolineaceae bacterium]
MNLKLSKVLMTLVSCLFFGITIGSIGIGAAFPPANLIAGPFVCPNGQMKLVTQSEQPSSVQSITTISWYCVDRTTGAQTELGIFPMVLYSGAIYGIIAFLVSLLFMARSANKNPAPANNELVKARRILREQQGRQEYQEGAVDPNRYVDREKYDDLARRLQEEIEKNKKG